MNIISTGNTISEQWGSDVIHFTGKTYSIQLQSVDSANHSSHHHTSLTSHYVLAHYTNHSTRTITIVSHFYHSYHVCLPLLDLIVTITSLMQCSSSNPTVPMDKPGNQIEHNTRAICCNVYIMLILPHKCTWQKHVTYFSRQLFVYTNSVGGKIIELAETLNCCNAVTSRCMFY